MTKRFDSDDRELTNDIMNSLKVSSYWDQIIDKVYNKKEIQKGLVPNYADPLANMPIGSNETEALPDCSITTDMMFKGAMQAMGAKGVLNAIAAARPQTLQMEDATPIPSLPEKSAPQFKISRNQYRALVRFPSLIEFLGTDRADEFVNSIASKVNEMMVEKIGENTKEVSKFAQVCVADGKNIKQYFAGENNEWVCMVIASGPFRGDELFYYKPESDSSFVLRKVGDGYIDVTKEFNIVHQVGKQQSA